MKSILKAIGSIAFTALLIFSIAACGEKPGGDNGGGQDLPGDINISHETKDSGFGVGDELIATYSGSETVTFQWKNGSSDVGTASTTNPNKYTPTEAGSYTVTVSAAGYKSKTSAAVEVTGESEPIESVSITIAIPVTGSEPVKTISSEHFTGSVAWDPNDDPFKEGVVYTATVTLTAEPGYTFEGLTEAKIGGQAAEITGTPGKTVTFSRTFAQTKPPAQAILIHSLMNTMHNTDFNHGDILTVEDFNGLWVTLLYTGATPSEDIEAKDFADNGITTDPAIGAPVYMSYNGEKVKFSYGSLTPNNNNTAALTVTLPTPPAPQNFEVSDWSGEGTITLTWDQLPAIYHTGGVTIDRYEVTKDDGATWETASTHTSHTFTGLSSNSVGNPFKFKVRAVVSITGGATENSTESDTEVVTPAIPSVPQHFETSVWSGVGTITLTWAASVTDNGSKITSYQVSSDGGTTWTNKASTDTSHTFNGLDSETATSFTFQVRAVNGIGNSTEATDVVATTAPTTPQHFTATTKSLQYITENGRQVDLAWAAPASDNGSKVTKYEVSVNNGAWVTPDTNTSHTFTDLMPGSYTFKVKVTNDRGETEAPATVHTVADPNEGMNGTTASKWKVWNAETLLQVGRNTGGWTRDNHYEQLCDITLSNSGTANFTPIGGYNAAFNGSYDGGEKTISNMKINTDPQFVGMFAIISAASTVKNVRLVNADVYSAYTSAQFYAGGLVAQNNGTVENCSFSGKVDVPVNSGSFPQRYVGGVVGRNEGTVKGCSFDGDVSNGTDTGGVVGQNYSGTVENCHSSGTVTSAPDGSNIAAGGVVGTSQGGPIGYPDPMLKNCSSTATVTGFSFTGGVVGQSSSSPVQNCYFNGSVIGSYRTGGVVGSYSGNLIVEYCYARGTVESANGPVGGILGSRDGAVVKNCVALNDSITVTTGTNIRRIAWESSSGFDNFVNNYASTVGTWSLDNLYSSDGHTITATEFNDKTWWEAAGSGSYGTAYNPIGPGWDFSSTSVWEWDSATNLPKLK